METIGDRIAEISKKMGLSNRKLAEKIGLTPTAVGKYILGQSEPGYGVIRKLKETIPTLSLIWLIEGKGEMWEGGENNLPITNDPPAAYGKTDRVAELEKDMAELKHKVEQQGERILKQEKMWDSFIKLAEHEARLREEDRDERQQQFRKPA